MIWQPITGDGETLRMCSYGSSVSVDHSHVVIRCGDLDDVSLDTFKAVCGIIILGVWTEWAVTATVEDWNHKIREVEEASVRAQEADRYATPTDICLSTLETMMDIPALSLGEIEVWPPPVKILGGSLQQRIPGVSEPQQGRLAL